MKISPETALQEIKAGNVVAIPTETVYGLAADMHHQEAVEKIFAVKQRPNDKPLLILAADIDDILPFIPTKPPDFDTLIRHFWPGALTIVVPVDTDAILDIVRHGLPTAGFRIPNHPITLELLSQSGPLVVTSANISGQPSAKSVEAIETIFGANFPVLDGGPCLKGQESTIISYDQGRWNIIREGAISPLEIEKVLGYKF